MFKLQANMAPSSLWSGAEPPLTYCRQIAKSKVARAETQLPEAGQLNREPRDINRDETYARGDRARRPGEKVTSLQIYRASGTSLSEVRLRNIYSVSRLALRFLPSENFGRPHTEKMGSHARR